MAEKASARSLDLTNVKDGGGQFTKKRQIEGDYKGRITMVQDQESRKDNAPMWVYTVEVNGETYPWYCKLVENQLWKVRAIFAAAGIVIPKKRMKIDPNKIVGKYIGVTLQDAEYEGRLQSDIRGVIPVGEIQGNADDEDVDDSYDDEEEEEETPPPAPARRKSKPAPAPEPEEEEEEDAEEEDAEEEEEEEAPPPPKRRPAKKAAPAAKGKSRVVDDEDLEDLDLEDL